VIQVRRYKIGTNFTDDDVRRWKDQLIWWINETMPKVENPDEQADRILLAAMNGTKIDGSFWQGVSDDFFKRIKVLASYDLEKGIGTRRIRSKKQDPRPKLTDEDLPPIDMSRVLDIKARYKKDLITKYGHLDSPVYEPKVDELAETVAKSRAVSQDFLTAKGKTLEQYNKIRESLHKQIDGLMKMLEIAPEQLMKKQKEADSADVGSLVAELESYGEVWRDFERIDALRELIQFYHMLNAQRPDGTPQLNDWELWHMTRNRPVRFTCRCGEVYELLGGFTPEEIEQALQQAYKVYGYGLKPLEGLEYVDPLLVNEELLDQTIAEEMPTNVVDNDQTEIDE